MQALLCLAYQPVERSSIEVVLQLRTTKIAPLIYTREDEANGLRITCGRSPSGDALDRRGLKKRVVHSIHSPMRTPTTWPPPPHSVGGVLNSSGLPRTKRTASDPLLPSLEIENPPPYGRQNHRWDRVCKTHNTRYGLCNSPQYPLEFLSSGLQQQMMADPYASPVPKSGPSLCRLLNPTHQCRTDE